MNEQKELYQFLRELFVGQFYFTLMILSICLTLWAVQTDMIVAFRYILICLVSFCLGSIGVYVFRKETSK